MNVKVSVWKQPAELQKVASFITSQFATGGFQCECDQHAPPAGRIPELQHSDFK